MSQLLRQAFLALLVMLYMMVVTDARSTERSGRMLLGGAAAGGKRGAGKGKGGDDSVHSSIAYGLPATDTDFPYMVALLDSEEYWAGCGGTLIRPRLVVTAAHCVRDDRGRLQDIGGVYIGLLNWGTDTERMFEYRRVTRIIPHPGYSPYTSANDIALLVLDRPAKTKPVAMAPRNYRITPVNGRRNGGDWLYVAGWGETENFQSPSHLLYAQVPAISKPLCNYLYQNEFHSGSVPASHICAGYADDNQDSCPGDSGGPLVKKTRNGHVLVGVVSFGPGGGFCGSDQNLGAYTSIMAMRPWIDGRMRALRV